MSDKLVLNFGAKFQGLFIIAMGTFLGTINKSKTRDCECNLPSIVLKGNQMVYS